jgi:Ni/Co efflux regulator RcnB
MDPPYGYVWVRNDQDAMLVDVQSGLILSVQYNLFFS